MTAAKVPSLEHSNVTVHAKKIAGIVARLQSLSLPERLVACLPWVNGCIRFTTSFGLEDQALTHAIATHAPAIEIVTIDTGRLFPETYDVWGETEERYGIRIKAVTPARELVEAFVSAYGVNGFRASLESRQACCAIRKSEPLRGALAGASAWITGLRAAQSQHRGATPLAEFDAAHSLIKINPLADWTRREVANYVADNRIPYNVLHDRGFPSIGCAPCTRAVRLGEPERAGRWWWEQDQKKECGLHLPPVAAPRSAPAITPERELA
jgi:phosphoadenosine phosphosulfate reductase